MTKSNDNRTFSDVFPRKDRVFIDRSLFATCEGLKGRGISQDLIVQALFDYALAEATSGPDYDPDESASFVRNVHMMKHRIDALVDDIDSALAEDRAHHSSSA